MLVINSIEKSRLQADSFSYSGSGVAWKARFVLFLGFALLAGGLAGSVVCAYPNFLDILLLLLYVKGTRALLTRFSVDGYGSQVPHQGLPSPDALLWNCKYCGQWSCYAQVCVLADSM